MSSSFAFIEENFHHAISRACYRANWKPGSQEEEAIESDALKLCVHIQNRLIELTILFVKENSKQIFSNITELIQESTDFLDFDFSKFKKNYAGDGESLDIGDYEAHPQKVTLFSLSLIKLNLILSFQKLLFGAYQLIQACGVFRYAASAFCVLEANKFGIKVKKNHLIHPIKHMFLFLRVLALSLSQDWRYRIILRTSLEINSRKAMRIPDEEMLRITSPSLSACDS